MFGKVQPLAPGMATSAPAAGETGQLRREDVSRALLNTISQVIAQVAHMSAVQCQVDRIVFSGAFLSAENAISMRTLSFFTHLWSGGRSTALFLRHEGYAGALGALLTVR
mmetsp:Transcript_4771/g.13228  ORF Transcript_4771/g.13228 Transcript_4771/m.13228 type:complete len:110 (-) Transcript_4771:110-439(-)